MNVDLELYAELLQAEVKKLRTEAQLTRMVDEDRVKAARTHALHTDVAITKPARDPISVDLTKMSPPVREEAQKFMASANSSMSSLLTHTRPPTQ